MIYNKGNKITIKNNENNCNKIVNVQDMPVSLITDLVYKDINAEFDYNSDIVIKAKVAFNTDKKTYKLRTTVNECTFTNEITDNLDVHINEEYKVYNGTYIPIGLRTIRMELLDGEEIIDSKEYIIMITEMISSESSIFDFENKCPYISTYHIQGVYDLGEDIVVDYFLDDYDYTYNRLGNTNYEFTVTAKIEGKDEIVIEGVKAGDNTINFGSFDTEGERILNLQAVDQYGRESHILYYDVLIKDNSVEPVEYEMVEQDLVDYNITLDEREILVEVEIDIATISNKVNDIKSILTEEATNTTVPSGKYAVFVPVDKDTKERMYYANASTNSVVKYADDYDTEKVATDALNTTNGLNKFIKDKAAQGYNRIKLINAIYRVSHKGQISGQNGAVLLQSNNVVLDLNGSTIKMNQFTGSGCLVISISAFNSHIINGTIQGDYYTHDYVNSTNNSEWCQLAGINGDAKYCTFDNMIMRDSAGYGFVNGIANVNNKTYTTGKIASYGKYEIGDIDTKTGEFKIGKMNRVTSDYCDVSQCGTNKNGDIEICNNLYLGYQGNGCGNWCIKLSFYDENKNYIGYVTTYQYRRAVCPKGTKYIRLTNFGTNYNNNISAAYWNVPTNCAFKNMKVINTRGTGSANSAMRNMLFENIDITCCGQNVTPTGMDFEDGWDMMQDVTTRNVNFYQRPGSADFLTCAGHNIIVEDMKNGGIYFWGRTRNTCVRNCTINSLSSSVDDLIRSGDRRFHDNTFNCGVSSNKANDGNKLYFGKNNTFNQLVTNANVSAGSIVTDTGGGKFTNCKFMPIRGGMGYINNHFECQGCEFINEIDKRTGISFNSSYKNIFFKCNFKGAFNFSNHLNFDNGYITDCNFEDFSMDFNATMVEGRSILFKNCNIYANNSYLIKAGPYAYTVGKYVDVQFINCNIKLGPNTTNLYFMYAAPNGTTLFKDCTIEKEGDTTNFYLLYAYPSNQTTNTNVIFENCTINENLKYYNEKDSGMNNKITSGGITITKK